MKGDFTVRGMSSEQFHEILEFVQKYHNFANLMSASREDAIKTKYPNMDEYGFNIKYVDSVYDTRTRSIQSVSFRGMGRNLKFAANSFMLEKMFKDTFPFDNLFDWIMAFLKGDWNDKEVIETVMKQNQ